MINTDVKISSHGYEAHFSSLLGGTCYRLFHAPTKSEILRTPKDENELFSEIYLFGNPMLFPCNRIRGGEFVFEGRKYSFPINEPSSGCHIHGELYKTRFDIKNLENDRVSFVFSAKAGDYLNFPHAFEIERTYILGENGLSENVRVTNLSDENMPFMLAFHTTLNIPFSALGEGASCTLKLPVVREQFRDENYLPTLKYACGRERDRALEEGKYNICAQSVSALYETNGEKAEIYDEKAGASLVYEGDENYRYRMLWRRDGANFVVIEPQTCAIDCFHLENSAEENGLVIVKPSETVSLSTRFSIKTN